MVALINCLMHVFGAGRIEAKQRIGFTAKLIELDCHINANWVGFDMCIWIESSATRENNIWLHEIVIIEVLFAARYWVDGLGWASCYVVSMSRVD